MWSNKTAYCEYLSTYSVRDKLVGSMKSCSRNRIQPKESSFSFVLLFTAFRHSTASTSSRKFPICGDHLQFQKLITVNLDSITILTTHCHHCCFAVFLTKCLVFHSFQSLLAHSFCLYVAIVKTTTPKISNKMFEWWACCRSNFLLHREVFIDGKSFAAFFWKKCLRSR